ncbi:FliG C-terminal domain-containing protein [Pontiellaceae bacterium B1224]|nr:FliG C-terminal domain-containing protein [Pontiellaceae bacterium B1224]
MNAINVSEQALVSQKMTPEKRVAVVLASLEPDVAAKVMRELDPHIMTRAAESIRSLGIVPGNLFRKAIAESLQELQAYNDAVHGNDSLAVGLLSKVVGEQQAASMLELGQMAGNRFGALVSRKPEEIARMLAAESSSVVAVVMRFLPSQLASETLSHISEDVRRKVVLQIATAELPSERVIDQIEQQLVSRLPASVKRKQDDKERIDSLVSIMQRSSKEVADAMLEELSKQDSALADLVRDRMFVFEDIARLDDAAVRRIMQELETGILSTALRKASDEVRNRFLSNMSRRAADGLQEEMEYAGKMPFSEVLAKQKEVVQVARTLAEQGEIKIGSSEEEYV